MNKYTNIVTKAAEIIRSVARRNFSSLKEKNISKKKDGSFVTDFDLTIDRELTQSLGESFPEINFISEESQDDTSVSSGLVWCIDPIDGTHNFMTNIPYYAVSVGLLFDGVPVAGIIYDPMEDVVVVGGEDVPFAFNNLDVRYQNESMIVVTGRSHSADDNLKEQEVAIFLMQSSDLKYRRLGSCAMDIMNLLRGRIGAVVVVGNSKWDWAAGYAIAKSAGFHIHHIDETHFVISSEKLKEKLSVLK